MGGVRLLFAMLAIVIAVAPITVVADATPEATPTAACVFPPISIDLLREIRDEIVANPSPPRPSRKPDTYRSRTHRMPFPPPPATPSTTRLLASVRQFLADYADCVVTGDILAVYGALTDDFTSALRSASARDNRPR